MVAGQTQAYWAQKWWNWTTNIRQEINPSFEVPSAADPTGGKYASINNDGPVVFLPGSFVGDTAPTVTIPPNRPVLVPIVTQNFIAFPYARPCPDPLTLACALGVIAPGFDHATGLSITVDGIRLAGSAMLQFRQTSKAVTDLWVNPDPNSIYDLFGKLPEQSGYYPHRAVQDGYWIFLDRLSIGKHQVRTEGTVGAPFPLHLVVMTTICVGLRTNVFGDCRE